MKLTRDPKVVRLARELNLDLRGDCAKKITKFALDRIRQLIDGVDVKTLDTMLMLVANRLRAKCEFLRTDADIDRIADDYAQFHPALRGQLRREFIAEKTEGITLERDGGDGRSFQFLAVIDARGTRAVRAYFTAWHELVHLLIHPPQLAFLGFRRSPSPELIEKDPIESLVDLIAGRVAFYAPIYEPVLRQAITDAGGLSFQALEGARVAAAPNASFFAAALAGIRFTTQPALMISVGERFKKSEAREIGSDQLGLSLGLQEPRRQLRVVTATPSGDTNHPEFQIFSGMRVPRRSILTTAFESRTDISLRAIENQNWWETSGKGMLPGLPLQVDAVRRGGFVYGLLIAAS